MMFRKVLLNWYKTNKRNLPWRGISDPYKIWISEIMLQQTRVNQAIGYYSDFLEKFPNIYILAKADEKGVLKSWAGLGYYSRARNLHKTAKEIVEKKNGIFPSDYNEIISLRGIGEYTAAAIASLAFKQPYAVVDGNVCRILTRYFGIYTPIDSSEGKKKLKKLTGKLLDKENPDEYNQAIMEFGALQCTPVPKCNSCPLIDTCLAYQKKIIKTLPRKTKKITIKKRYFNYLLISDGKGLLINQRKQNDIWKNLYELPLIETSSKITLQEMQKSKNWMKIFGKTKVETVEIFEKKHQLTHQGLFIKFFTIECSSDFLNKQNNYIHIPTTKYKEYPYSVVIEKYLQQTFR